MSPTIYHYQDAFAVSQKRYDALIARGKGWSATPTSPTADGTQQNIPVTSSAVSSAITTALTPVNSSIATNTSNIATNTAAIAQTVTKTDQRLAGKFPYPRPKVVTHVTSMQTSHGWTASGALANAMNDGTTFVMGSQSAYITSKTDGTAATLTSATLSPTLDISGTKQLRLLIKVDNSDNINGMYLYVSSDAMVANFSAVPIQTINADPGVRWIKDGEWKWVTVNVGSGTDTGTPNFAAVNSLRIRLVSNSGFSSTVHLQAVQVVERKSFASGGIVCFTYDDSYRSQYSLARVHLDKWGFPGTAFTIHSNITDGDGGNTSWMTTQMLSDLRDYNRWEIALHCDTLTNHGRAFSAATNATTGTVYGTNPLSATELNTDITNELEWLMANNLTDGFIGHCYPQGRFNTTVRRQMANRVAYARAMTATSNGMETIPPADPYAIRCYTLDNTTVLSTVQGIIDRVALHGGLAVFCIHDIVTSPSTSTQVSTANHQGIVDYVAGKSGLRVMTLGDVMRGLTAQG
jgi:hypothetical protein